MLGGKEHPGAFSEVQGVVFPNNKNGAKCWYFYFLFWAPNTDSVRGAVCWLTGLPSEAVLDLSR